MFKERGKHSKKTIVYKKKGSKQPSIADHHNAQRSAATRKPLTGEVNDRITGGYITYSQYFTLMCWKQENGHRSEPEAR